MFIQKLNLTSAICNLQYLSACILFIYNNACIYIFIYNILYDLIIYELWMSQTNVNKNIYSK